MSKQGSNNPLNIKDRDKSMNDMKFVMEANDVKEVKDINDDNYFEEKRSLKQFER